MKIRVHFTVSNDSVSEQWSLWLDCVNMQADLGFLLSTYYGHFFVYLKGTDTLSREVTLSKLILTIYYQVQTYILLE